MLEFTSKRLTERERTWAAEHFHSDHIGAISFRAHG
jgi:hypothetical protein